LSKRETGLSGGNMTIRRILIVMTIATSITTTLACSVTRTVSEAPEKMEIAAEKITLELWADNTTITKGQCTVVHWRTTGGPARINQIAVDPSGDSESCPTETKEYVLLVGDNLGSKRIVINVQAGGSQSSGGAQPQAQNQSQPSLDFWADRTTINKGECTTLHWRASGGGVWIGEKGYPPVSEMQVCPAETKKYTAEVGDQFAVKSLVITVQGGGAQAPAAQPQQPSTNNQNNQSNSSPKVVFAVTSVKLSFEPGADSGVIAAISTNAAGKVGWAWYWKGSVACHGGLEFSAAGTKTARCPVSGGKGGTMEFYLWQPIQQLYGSVNLPLINIDLAVNDIFPDNMPRGNVFVRITNRGPDAGNGQEMVLNCQAILTPLPGMIAAADPISVKLKLINSQSKGETKEFDTTIDVDSDSFSYMITCNISHDYADSNSANNYYRESIP
jgi:hypothetical protein